MVVSVHEAKTLLSRLLQQIAAGEDVIITRSGQPVARLVPIDETRPVFGVDEGRFVFPDDFDAPLDEESLRVFVACAPNQRTERPGIKVSTIRAFEGIEAQLWHSGSR